MAHDSLIVDAWTVQALENHIVAFGVDRDDAELVCYHMLEGGFKSGSDVFDFLGNVFDADEDGHEPMQRAIAALRAFGNDKGVNTSLSVIVGNYD